MFQFLKSDNKAADAEALKIGEEAHGELRRQTSADIEELSKLRAAMENITTAIMMIDRDMMITYVNEETRSLLKSNEKTFRSVWPDFIASEIIGSCVDRFHDDPNHQRAILANPANLPWKTTISVAHLRFRLTITAQRDGKGEYVGNTLEWKDVTESRKQEQQNRYYAAQLNAIEKSQATVEFDADMVFVRANHFFLDAVGYSENEMIGVKHERLVPQSYKDDGRYNAFLSDLRSGKFLVGEYLRKRKDGSDLWLQATYIPIMDEDGKLYRVVKFATDVTEIVSARLQREEASKMVDDNLAKIVSAIGTVNQQTSTASAASTQTLQTVQTVAAAAEEFQASATEIARSMESSRSQVAMAQEEATRAGQSTRQLEQAAQSMNNIVSVIQDIASQINLLALNATIESARAGEAGRGFAVVANEVKSLAGQVAQATDQIASEISAMQDVSTDVVGKLDAIGSAVDGVQTSISTVASAAEEQAAATHEISTSMQTATDAVSDVSTSLHSISDSVSSANTLAEEGINLYRSAAK